MEQEVTTQTAVKGQTVHKHFTWATPVVCGVLIVGGYFAYQKYAENKRQQDASGALQSDPNAQLATRIYNILDNAGALDWYTNLKYVLLPPLYIYKELTKYQAVLQVLEVAKSITDWQAVQKRYTDLFHDDITVILNKILRPEDYSKFLTMMQVKGQPTNLSESGTYTVLQTSLKSGATLYFNAKADAAAVNLYKAAALYPGAPYITLATGKKTRNPLEFRQAVKFRYLGSSVDTVLYQVQIPNISLPVFINDYYLSQSLSGLAGIDQSFAIPMQVNHDGSYSMPGASSLPNLSIQ